MPAYGGILFTTSCRKIGKQMTNLTSIKDIARELFVDEGIDFREERAEVVPQDELAYPETEGQAVLSAVVIVYTKGDIKLKIQEVVVLDDERMTYRTIDYVFSEGDKELLHDCGFYASEEELKNAIRRFVGQ